MSKRDARSNQERTQPAGKQRVPSAKSGVGTPQSSRLTKQERRRERREEQHRQQTQSARTRQLLRVGFIVVGVVVVIFSSYFLFNFINAQRSTASSGTPIPSATSIPIDNPLYPPVDNVYCQSRERGEYHVHALVNIYINGKAIALPQNMGIASDSSCLYWLHTHTGNGIVHVEAPEKQTYTVGTFLDIWNEQFSQEPFPAELQQTSGWQVYLNGKPYDGNFREMTLDEHVLITLAYNSPGITPISIFNWGDL